jgi:hypothetical protein
MTRVETTTMLARLLQAADDAEERMLKLHPLLTEQENDGPSIGTIGRHAPESSEPWAMHAASAYWDLYFGAREMARAMRGAARLRRPCDVCGAEALVIVRNMAPTAQEFILRGVTRRLERLVRQADAVPAIDEQEEWVPLPRLHGGMPLPCPYCGTYGLRMLRRKGEVRCFFPDCRDADGKPTRARMETGRMTGEELLIFGDGTTMGGGA